MRSSGSHVLARPERYLLGVEWHGWSKEVEDTHLSGGHVIETGEVLALAERGGETQTMVATPSEQKHNHPTRPETKTWATCRSRRFPSS